MKIARVEQVSNGEWYVERRTSSRPQCVEVWRNWWLIKWVGGRRKGYLIINPISFPKEFVGKKIRLKVEVIEE